MRRKKGVSWVGVHYRMRDALMVADVIYKDRGHELVVTSLNDGVHGEWSYHYFGLAADLRIWYFKDDDERRAVAGELQRALRLLDNRYDVVLELELRDENGKIIKGGHIHVEFDIKRARRAPGRSDRYSRGSDRMGPPYGPQEW